MADGALAMAAVRTPMRGVKFLIHCGADPATENWLAYRMAAANGDQAMLEWLRALSEPSPYALTDASHWAEAFRMKSVSVH